MVIFKRPTDISKKRDLKSFKGPVHAKVTNFYRFTKIISDVPKNGEIENFRMKLGKPEKFICASGELIPNRINKVLVDVTQESKKQCLPSLFPNFPWLTKLFTHLYSRSQLHIVLSENLKSLRENIPKLH